MRYYANGTLDTSFGTNGSTETAFFYNGGRGEMADYVRYDSVHVGLSSKIVVSGWGGFYAGNPNPNFALIARYWGN